VSTPARSGLTPPAPLAADHDLSLFACGLPQLDDWLRRRAQPNESGGTSRTFVVCDGGQVIGYYSLAAGSVLHDITTRGVRRNMPDPVPVALIGRLAVDRRFQRQGIGAALLRDAVLRVIGAAETIGIRAILVHAMTEEAKQLYERFGFAPSPIEPMTVMITVEAARRIVAGNASRR
jgi:GNAT superfamily N-acetyltransferase